MRKPMTPRGGRRSRPRDSNGDGAHQGFGVDSRPLWLTDVARLRKARCGVIRRTDVDREHGLEVTACVRLHLDRVRRVTRILRCDPERGCTFFDRYFALRREATPV